MSGIGSKSSSSSCWCWPTASSRCPKSPWSPPAKSGSSSGRRRATPREGGARAGAGPGAVPLDGAGRDHAGRHHGRRVRRRDDSSEPLAAVISGVPVTGAVRRRQSRSALVVAGITLLSLILGELVPKNIGLQLPRADRLVGGRPMMRAGAHRRTDRARVDRGHQLRAAAVRHQGSASEPGLTEDEIRRVISEGAETGVVEAAEENIVQRVFQLGDQRVAAIMTPRVDIEWVDVDITQEELREFLASHATRVRRVPRAVSTTCWAPCARRSCCRPFQRREDRSAEPADATRSSCPTRCRPCKLLESFRSSHKSCRAGDGRVRRGRRAGHHRRSARRRWSATCPPTPAKRRARSCRAPTAHGSSRVRRRWTK